MTPIEQMLSDLSPNARFCISTHGGPSREGTRDQAIALLGDIRFGTTPSITVSERQGTTFILLTWLESAASIWVLPEGAACE